MVNTYSIPVDTTYDRVTRMAAKLLHFPISILIFNADDKINLKSIYGICHHDLAIPDFNAPQPFVIQNFDVQFITASPLITQDGKVHGSLYLVDDKPRVFSEKNEAILSEFADMAVAYIELTSAADRVVLQQRQLLQIAAHDLKNPLTTIPVRADLIKLKKNDPEIVDRMCDQIKLAGLKMTRTIDELLQMGCYEAGKINLHTFKLDFAAIVAQVIETNEALATDKGQRIELFIESRPYVNADEQKLMEIVDNLVNNAVKYSPKGEVIRVIVQQQHGKAMMQVQDNGPGLTLEDKTNMFQPYSKLSAHPTGKENSTGLGLSIVKQLVEAHHGQVWAESDGMGKGSTFFVEMPSFN
jgi:signal transduction histidine kinase